MPSLWKAQIQPNPWMLRHCVPILFCLIVPIKQSSIRFSWAKQVLLKVPGDIYIIYHPLETSVVMRRYFVSILGWHFPSTKIYYSAGFRIH